MAGPNAPPDFQERLESTAVRQGDAIVLSAVITGNPAPVVAWYREGMEIQSDQDFVISVEGRDTPFPLPTPTQKARFLIFILKSLKI